MNVGITGAGRTGRALGALRISCSLEPLGMLIAQLAYYHELGEVPGYRIVLPGSAA